jgi:hypothetical protein
VLWQINCPWIITKADTGNNLVITPAKEYNNKIQEYTNTNEFLITATDKNSKPN